MFIRWKMLTLSSATWITGRSGAGRSISVRTHCMAKMFAAGEIGREAYEKIVRWEPEGILQLTFDGGLNFSIGFLKGSKIGIFFDHWLYGRVDKDEHGWRLVDENGNIVGLRPGMRMRLWF